MAKQLQRTRPLRIRKQQQKEEILSVNLNVIEKLIERKVKHLETKIEELQAKTNNLTDVLVKVENTVSLAAAGDGSTRTRLDELIDSLQNSLTGLGETKALREDNITIDSAPDSTEIIRAFHEMIAKTAGGIGGMLQDRNFTQEDELILSDLSQDTDEYDVYE